MSKEKNPHGLDESVIPKGLFCYNEHKSHDPDAKWYRY